MGACNGRSDIANNELEFNEWDFSTMKETDIIGYGEYNTMWGFMKNVLDENGMEYSKENIINLIIVAAAAKERKYMPKS
tara:strand:+ start:408 stop:644 length:237 start_codon:yes stop_codon:yes gene_type:complete